MLELLKAYRTETRNSVTSLVSWTALFLLPLLLQACASSPLRRLEESMDPMVGKKKRGEVERLVGQPVKCSSPQPMTRCEYRTLIGRNDPAPVTSKVEPGFGGPDLSPYEFFDVIEIFYDATGMMSDWRPLSIRH